MQPAQSTSNPAQKKSPMPRQGSHQQATAQDQTSDHSNLLNILNQLLQKSQATMSLIVAERQSPNAHQSQEFLQKIYMLEQQKRSDMQSMKQILTKKSPERPKQETTPQQTPQKTPQTRQSKDQSEQLSLFQTDKNGIQHLNLERFKVIECKNPEPHNPKNCPYYHGQLDKRRCTTVHNYGVDFCPLKNCTNINCKYVHNKVERLYHIEKYKTKFCTQTVARCEYKQFCSFAHTDQDIKTPLIHKMPRNQEFFMFYFKTEWCPFNYEHNKAQCVYAHNWQDFRRKPHLFSYNPFEICEKWQAGNFIGKYEEGCPLQASCTKYHGWKEQIYHPMVYKTIFCDDAEQKYPEQKLQQCQKSLQCGYYHSEKDRRTVNLDENEPSKLQPFEKIVYNTRTPHNQLVVTNPNHLNHFLRTFHTCLQLDQPLWGADLQSLHMKFQQWDISRLILRFIEQRSVVPITQQATKSHSAIQHQSQMYMNSSMYSAGNSFAEKKNNQSLNQSGYSKTGDSTRDESRSFTNICPGCDPQEAARAQEIDVVPCRKHKKKCQQQPNSSSQFTKEDFQNDQGNIFYEHPKVSLDSANSYNFNKDSNDSHFFKRNIEEILGEEDEIPVPPQEPSMDLHRYSRP